MSDSVWHGLSAQLRSTEIYRQLRAAVEADGVVARGADGARPVALERTPLALAAWCCELLRQDLDRSVLAIVGREADAATWLEASRLFGRVADSHASVHFPSPSLTPYQEAKAALHTRAGEAHALDAILVSENDVAPSVVCTPRALFQRLPQRDDFLDLVRVVRPGDVFGLEEWISHLVAIGFRRSDLVAEVGVFAVRGGVFDLFPPGEELPVRFDLFGDEVESIRQFDPATQRSARELESLRVRPLGLFRSSEVEAMELAERLKDVVEVSPHASGCVEELMSGRPFAGWENWLPLTYETTGLAHLLDDAVVVAVEPGILNGEIEHYRALLDQEHDARFDQERMVVLPELLVCEEDGVEDVVEGASVQVDASVAGPGDRTTPTLALDFGASLTENLQKQLPRFPREVETARARGERLLLLAPRENHDKLREYLEGGPGGQDLSRDVDLVEGDLTRGFRVPVLEITLFSEEQLFARRPAPGTRRRQRFGPFLSGLRDLKVGDFVVHEDHGVGQFTGMRGLLGEPEVGGSGELPPSVAEMADPTKASVEVMEITYAQGKTLLLPLDRIHQIQKYSGIDTLTPRLDRLGGTSWASKKSRVKKGLRKLATDLLKLYAERELASAPAMPADSDLQHQFEAAFEFEETEDQLDAVSAIKADLEREKPMDRLLCGDVGFGKTEVSMRAAFKVVDGGYQVAVLAPTTILADQHLETFRRRYADFPIEVDMISRFRTSADIKKVRERVASGHTNILVGTHRLLSRDVDFANLGLVIVDEEQRFGVAQKERLKEIRRDVHVLAMSATPVPRTLQLSLAGVRDLSVIETPPKDRMAVETRILPFSADLVKESIEYELERGGQVYYVYNRVEGIEEVTAWLRELVPSVRITVGHGQMDERELSDRMHAFTRGEFDVLIATTIIENGIDIPNVNTMLVHRADRFGLAQLYQLRGRVGRSDQLAFCYLMVPSDRVLTEVARQRLAAIREFTDLGAGFRIAARDLEIRGAGTLLGAEQSGHIAELGIETYLKMLEDTVRELRGEEAHELPSASIDLPVIMTIPQDYIGDTNLRMEIYRRLSSAHEDVDEVLQELRDRFGPPPESVLTLIRAASLKRLAEELRVQSIAAKGQKLTFRMRQDARIDVETLIRFVSEHGGAHFSPSGVLTISSVPAAESLAVARATLESLAPVSYQPGAVLLADDSGRAVEDRHDGKSASSRRLTESGEGGSWVN